MLSNAQSKYIRSLTQQKYRKQYNVFLAEGDKIAVEWLKADMPVKMVVATQDWVDTNTALIAKHSEAELCIVSQVELEKVSALQAAHKALLVVPIPELSTTLPSKGWCIALDNLQDPGNMGTIIRIADWFGISHVIASHNSVDFYNPKVVQAAMGGHLRVKLHRADLEHYIKNTDLPVFAAALDGNNVFELPKTLEGIILIGNESKGLSVELLNIAGHKITIPRKGGAESLNAAVSAGIITALLAGR